MAVGIVTALLVGLFWALAGLLALLLVGLCIPFRAAGMVKDLSITESGGANLEVASWWFQADWCFGLVSFASAKESGGEIKAELWLVGFSKALEGGGAKRRRMKPPAKGAKPRGRRRRGISGREVFALLPELRLLVARLWRSLGLEAEGDLTYGLEDPYVTGLCEGLRALVPWPGELRLTPDFGEAKLEGWAQVRMTLFPIKPAAVMVGAFFRRGVRRIWWPRLKARFVGSS